MAAAVDLADDGFLVAPCGSDYLHQTDVRVVWVKDGIRDGVVVETSMYITVQRPSIQEDRFGRRQSMEIDFWCEQCAKTHTLIIHQHKGNTIFLWKGRA